MRRRPFPIAVIVALSAGAGCAAPHEPPAAPSGSPVELRGRIVDTVHRTPVAGAQVMVGRERAAADADGRFLLALAASDDRATVTAPGHLERILRLDLSRSRDDLVIDLIRDAAPFDLGRYREFARDAWDRRGLLRGLSRWKVRPSFFIRTVHDDTGAPIPADFIAAMHEVIQNSVAELSGGTMRDPVIETGPERRADTAGWVRVFFRTRLSNANAHGQGTVGGESGSVELRFDDASPRPSANFPARCAAYELQVLEHELTHVMGFYHTSIWPDGSAFNSLTGCSGADRSVSARHFAAIVYARNAGNVDIDEDRHTLTSIAAGLPAPVACEPDALRLGRGTR
jgi:hypothetical protein